MRKRLAITTAALALLAPAAAAEAGSYKTARFVAYAEGKQVTKWKVPRHEAGGDCQGERFRESGGEETVKWRTKPMRIFVEKPPTGSVAHVKYGTWKRFAEPPKDALAGRGTVYRAGFEHHIVEPGWCFGGGPTVTDTGPYDCGERGYQAEVLLNWSRGRVEVSTSGFPRALIDYDNCPIDEPAGVTAGHWEVVHQRYPLRDLFDRSQGLVEVLGRKTWTDKTSEGAGTTTTVATFKLRLRRAR